MEEYPFVEGRCKELRDNLKGYYEFKIRNYRLIFRANLDSKRVQLVWLKAKPFAY
jgi:mRNA-degrading endonuclease RelE of RelBE toxin-antitoxin system